MTTTALGASLVVSGVSLGGGLLGVLCAERFDSARIRNSVLTRRWLTWVAIAVVVLTAVAGGELLLLALFTVLAAVATVELRSLLQLSEGGSIVAAFTAPAFLIVVIEAPEAAVTVAMVAFTAPLLADVAAGQCRHLDAVIGAAGPLAIAAALVGAPRVVGAFEVGAELFAATLFAVAIGDVGAYVAGRTLGGPRLAPRISPGKRWSGVLGNVGGALLAFAAFDLLLLDGIGGPWLLLAPLVAVAAVVGDLLESAVKRYAGVKDAGDWLPGFGGLLDRIDSSLLALPVAYVTASALGWEVI